MDAPSEKMQTQAEAKIAIQQKKYVELLVKMETYFEMGIEKKLNCGTYAHFSIIDPQDPHRLKYAPLLQKIAQDAACDPSILELSVKESRAIGSFIGLAVCDALGASTQFIGFEKERRHLIANDFEDVRAQIKSKVLDARCGKVGIWTDDCSMALCLADSLLLRGFRFEPVHARYMFHMWLEHGLNNGGRPYAIGLGGNISISMKQFRRKQTAYAIEEDKFNNGNGSLMRLAPIPICFAGDISKAMDYAALQSRTTHNGDEAKQCARLMSAIIVNLINRQSAQNWKEVIEQTCGEFETDVKAVKCLALSQQEPHELFEEQRKKYKSKFVRFNKKEADRNWNWKDPHFSYSPFRVQDNPGYVGSYCMDALSMALHTVWHGSSFKEVALVNANMGGDSDTVGAIAGQIAGAIYGVSQQMMKLYSQMEDCRTEKYDVFLKAYKLYNHESLYNGPMSGDK